MERTMKKRKKQKKRVPMSLPPRAEVQYALLESASLGLFEDDSFVVGTGAVGVDCRWGISYLFAASNFWQMHREYIAQWPSLAEEMATSPVLSDQEKTEHALIGLGYIRFLTRCAHAALRNTDPKDLEDYWFREDASVANRVEEPVEKIFGGISGDARQKNLTELSLRIPECRRNLNRSLRKAWELHLDFGVPFFFQDAYFREEMTSKVDARLAEYFDLGLSHFDLERLPETARHWGYERNLRTSVSRDFLVPKGENDA